jgi:hypothetical protein
VTTVAQLAHHLRSTITDTASAHARSSGFITRQCQLTAASFVRGLVFGWLAHPHASYSQLARAVTCAGSPISAQGLEQRFTKGAAALLQEVVAAAVTVVIEAQERTPSLLQRFTAVWVLDSSTITLPDALHDEWLGSGRRPEQGSAGLKTHVALELRHGLLRGPLLGHARPHDKHSPLQPVQWGQESLRITDLGFYALRVLRSIGAQGGFWLCRAQVQTHLVTADGRCWSLVELLAAHRHDEHLDLAVAVGAQERLPARLVAQPVTPEEAARRRRQVAYRARRKHHPVSQDCLALCAWNVCITNVPQDTLSAEEAFILLRARWQIEVLFKRWKSGGGVTAWRSRKPWRILCEVYAKLLAVLLQHWCVVVACWGDLDRSLVKASAVVQDYALALLRAVDQPRRLRALLVDLIQDCQVACRVTRRRTKPSYSQLIRLPGHVTLP